MNPGAMPDPAFGEPSDPQAWLRLGRSVLQSQPFSVWIGAQLQQLGPGGSVLRLALLPHHRQQGGLVHGGVLAYLADNALAFAGGSLLGADALTAEYKLSLVRPATGVLLLAQARVLHLGRTQAVCRCDVLDRDAQGIETLCATALGTIVRGGTR